MLKEPRSAPKLSVVLITKNEELNLDDCLHSVDFADEIVIVDSGSTDKTPFIAKRHGAKFSVREFDNFSAQKNHAIEIASGDWILLLDADERVSSSLKSEILHATRTLGEVQGYWIPRLNFFFGSPMRYGAGYHDRQLRLIQKGKGVFTGLVHERIELQGSAKMFNNFLEHYSSKDLNDYWKRFNLYTQLEAEQMVKKGKKPHLGHLLIKPFLEFLYFYFIKLGFLDGWRGFQYQSLSSYYSFTRYSKALQLFRRAKYYVR